MGVEIIISAPGLDAEKSTDRREPYLVEELQVSSFLFQVARK
jgi:hypothetical protein